MLKEKFTIHGRVEFFVTVGKTPVVIPIGNKKIIGNTTFCDNADIDFSDCQVIDHQDLKNIILNTGKDRVISSLTSGFIKTIARMAVGDRGTIPSDPTVPKTPVSTMTGLYNEVYRSDVDVVALNVGTPTAHEVKFIKTFSALDIPITSFSNQAKPVLNEVMLVFCDLLSGTPLPRPAVTAPGVNLADEEGFSIRCFKSVPFEAANEMAITVRYTVFIE